jgi:hypothetical protein
MRQEFSHNISSARLFLTCLIGFVFCSIVSAKSADFIVLLSPQALTIFNQYEQPLSATEKSQLSPSVPIQIIQNDVRLGDQITRAMQCAFEQKTVYVLKDEQGEIINGKGNIQILKACMLIEDTVEIVRDGAVLFSRQFPISPSSSALKKSEALVVFFRFGNSFAVRLDRDRPAERYGWCPASSQSAWRKNKTVSVVDTVIAPLVRDELNARIEKANELYKKFFDEFNRASGLQKSVPAWRTVNGAGLGWTLNAPYDHTGELNESTVRLVEEMRDVLIGKPFSAVYENGELTVKSKRNQSN